MEMANLELSRSAVMAADSVLRSTKRLDLLVRCYLALRECGHAELASGLQEEIESQNRLIALQVSRLFQSRGTA